MRRRLNQSSADSKTLALINRCVCCTRDMELARFVCLAVLAAVLMVGCASAQEAEDQEHYPLAWAEIDLKAVLDNDRLFKKYKSCILADKPTGCPRDVVQMKKLLPEVIETLCAKCLPQHIEKIRETLEHICKTRRADFEEVRKLKDPTGEIQKKFEDKYGKLNC